MELITIPKTFKKNTYAYELVERTEKVAMYKMSRDSGYEVHMIRVNKPACIQKGGKIINFPYREKLATTKEFGKFAWHYQTYERAKAKFEMLLTKMRLKHARIELEATKIIKEG